MKFIYPLELTAHRDRIAVQDDDGKVTYELVTAVYRQADKAVVETAEKRMLRLDPGLKVQADVPGGSPAPRPFNSNEWP